MKNVLFIPLLTILSFVSCKAPVNNSPISTFKETAIEDCGMIPERLIRLDSRIQTAIDDGEVAGTVAIIVRKGGIAYHKAFGYADKETKKPMEKNTLFRIASMSKLMTVVGALILYERGYYDLDTKLSDILPEFSEPEVFEAYDAQHKKFVTRKAKNSIRMYHLFTHTSGIVYPIFTDEGREGFLAVGVQDAWPNMEITLEENINLLASLPLAHEPGETWTYGTNMDVLGRVIEVMDGRSFNTFMEEELFGPLGLDDTGFEVPEADWGRVAQVYTNVDHKLSLLEKGSFFEPNNYADWWKRDADIIASGGGGLISSAYDYARFLQMLLNDGILDGHRILGRKTVELLRRPLYEPYGGKSMDFGLSVWVLSEEEAAYTQQSVGSYGWGGYFYTHYWVDPQEELVAVIMSQVSPAESDLNSDFEVLTYSAIE